MTETRTAPDTYSETFERTLDIAGMPTLRAVNLSGETRFVAGKSGRVVVRARKYVRDVSPERARRLLEGFEMSVDQHGGVISVQPHLHEHDRSSRLLFQEKDVAADLEIELPRECAIDARGAAALIGVRGTRGPLSIQNVSGAEVAHEGRHHRLVRIGDGAVRIQVNSTSGDLRVGRASSPPVVPDVLPITTRTPADAMDARSMLQRVARGELGIEGAQGLLRRGPDGGATRDRTLRIRVTESGTRKVNVAIPLAVARTGGKVKLGGLVQGHLGKYGIDLEEVLQQLEKAGRIVDIGEGSDRVEIFIDERP